MKGYLARLFACAVVFLLPLSTQAVHAAPFSEQLRAAALAIPEPRMMFLLGLALVGLVLVQRYKRKSR